MPILYDYFDLLGFLVLSYAGIRFHLEDGSPEVGPWGKSAESKQRAGGSVDKTAGPIGERKGEAMNFERRRFLQGLATAGGLEFTHLTPFAQALATGTLQKGDYKPGRIQNEYSPFLPGEREALASPPLVAAIQNQQVTLKNKGRTLKKGESSDGWKLAAIIWTNGADTAIFEKHVTHRGAIAYVTVERGVIANIPKMIGMLSSIRPRQINAPDVGFRRSLRYTPGPDVPGNYVLNSAEDPCYENVAALGPEYIGWTYAGDEGGGPEHCVFLEADGKSREWQADGQSAWAPDMEGRVFDPTSVLPGENPGIYAYQHGYSKRTLLGGYLPVANVGVWNPHFKAGYECMVLVTPGAKGRAIGRVRYTAPDEEPGAEENEHYIHTSPGEFYSVLAGIWNYWHDFYETSMPVEIPDEWLLDAARAGITLSRCSYRGLKPTYQIGEGAYTKIPERSHALFPVAAYEFVWAQQMWNLTDAVEPYFQYYLDHYILPDGNFLYNTQDQVEAPLNAGVFLANSARAYDYSGDADAFAARLPVLERMLAYVLGRYEYSKEHFPPGDPHHGLIWGSPEADFGDPQNDYPESHPYYFANSTWTWRGIAEHARCLHRIAREHGRSEYQKLGDHYEAVAREMRTLIERSFAITLSRCSPEMKRTGITPFTPSDTHHNPRKLTSYENHRFMQDFFTSDWGVEQLDLGHLRHRELAGMQIMGLATDGAMERTSNFMAHGTLAVRIRQQDYRPFLLNLYSLVSYAADSGNRYSPEDAWVPGGAPLQGNRYGWSAVVNSVLQPAMGLRWLLCYEDTHAAVCHLQKAAPKHWFASGEKIRVGHCPTRFGRLSWSTVAQSDSAWKVTIDFETPFTGNLIVNIHPPNGRSLRRSTAGTVSGQSIRLAAADLKSQRHLVFDVDA